MRNDAVIVEATADLLGEDGWISFTLASVARRAGLSVRPVRDRYADRLHLAAAAWDRLIAPVWSDSMAKVLASVSSGDASRLEAALTPFVNPGPTHRAAAELLAVAAHDESVRALVADAALTPLERALDPTPPGKPTQAAVHGYAVMLAMGLLWESWRSTAEGVDLASPLAERAAALSSPAEAAPLPSERATHLDRGPVIDTGDRMWDAVLAATLRQVGTRGYEAATVEAIAAEAGCSQTVLFRRYTTKADAFLDATRRMVGAAMELNAAYQQRIASEYSPGVSEATMMREFMHPSRQVERVIALEQYRLAWHDERLAVSIELEQAPIQDAYVESLSHLPTDEARARLHLELAMGMGAVILAQLVPDAWLLPYDVVTIPLLDGGA